MYALIVGLFSVRWALSALGQTDYGLYGVVGALTVLITFLNGIMSAAVGRFYAVCVGRINVVGESAIEECREWFTTAVVVHTFLPVVLVVAGYPVGLWAVENFLTIPADRLMPCVWVWRMACLSCFFGMLAVPYRAMYVAKQEIAELTIYDVASTTLRAMLLYYAVGHPGDWLVRYAVWMCVLSVAPLLIYMIRACVIFKECKLRVSCMGNWNRLRNLLTFAGWQCFGNLGSVCRAQGIAVLINKYFGARVNAASTLSISMSVQCNTLSSSMVGAFSPAIMNAYGEGRIATVRDMALRTSKMGALLTLFFAIPLSIEIDEVLFLWLKTPPRYSAGLCLFVLAMNVIDRLTEGQSIAISATGRIAGHQFISGGVLILTLPLAWVMIMVGLGPYAVGYSIILTMIGCSIGRLYFASRLVGMRVSDWFYDVFIRIVALLFVSVAIGAIPRMSMEVSVFRVCLTTMLSVFSMMGMAWLFVLTALERDALIRWLRRTIKQ